MFFGKSVPTTVVYQREEGITSADRARAERDAETIQREVLAADAAVPRIQESSDGKALLITFNVPASSDDQLLTKELKKVGSIVYSDDGDLTVKVAGAGGQILDTLSVFANIDSTLLLATAGVVAIVLLITYRSPILWLVPLASVAIADAVAQGLLYLLATHGGLTVNGQTQGILTVLVFGAGTDYALLLTARYREELHRIPDRHRAMAVAIHRAGPAIFASSTTVVLSLLCLLFAELNSDRGLGPACAIGIVVAFLAQMTLLPSLLLVFGRRIFWPFIPRAGDEFGEDATIWGRIGKVISQRPRTVWAATGFVLLLMAVGLVALNPNGLTQAQAFRNHPPSVLGQQIISEHFPAGSSDPAYLIANSSANEQVVAAAKATPGVESVVPAAHPVDGRQLNLVIFTSDPDSAAARHTVDELRTNVHAVPGADAIVGGTAATTLDTYRAAVHDRDIVIPIVLLVVLLVLIVLLRALVAPLLLIITVVLSYLAALGASALIFRHVFGFAGSDPSLPLFVFIFLVALGIDYNIFLMTRVREETLRIGTRAGTLKALAVTGGVITSAGVVLAATFAVLAVLPLVIFAEIGFAVAFGVLLDTLVVRCLMVPALVMDIGPPVWLPGHPDAGSNARIGRVRRSRRSEDVRYALATQSPRAVTNAWAAGE